MLHEVAVAPRKKTSSTHGPRHAESRSEEASVRIIAGEWRGRVLRFAGCDGLRPTGNRIRETLFNWLMPYLPGAKCLDAFSGSGALGFEALSRGADSVVMLEPNAEANRHLLNNAKVLGANRATIWGSRAEQFLSASSAEPFDVVFLDPPFALDLWPEIIKQLDLNGWLAEGALVYIETPKNYDLAVPSSWQLHRSKHTGNVSYSLYRCGDGV